MKKLIALVVVAAGLLVPTLAHAEVAFSATQWPPSWNQDMQNFQNTPLTHYAFDIVDTFNSGSTDYSFIRVSTPGPQPFCTSLQDEYCIPLAKKYGWWIIRLLPVCSTVDEKSECIEGLEVTGADGIKKKYVHSGTNSRNYFPADTERGLGVGSGSSMWVDPQAPDTGNGYFITVSGDAGGPADATTFPLTTFDATVVPFKTVLGNFDAPEAKIANGQGIFMTKPGTNWPPECIWMQKGKCGVATEFDSAVRLKFIVHLPSTLSHWVIGRLGTPALAIDPIGSIGTVSYIGRS